MLKSKTQIEQNKDNSNTDQVNINDHSNNDENKPIKKLNLHLDLNNKSQTINKIPFSSRPTINLDLYIKI